LIAKVIKISETGFNENCHNAEGGSGEISCYQMMPSTYKAYSIQVLGYVAEPTPTNVEYIATVKLGRLAEKYPMERIALMWNAGEGATKCSRGVNRWNQKYNSCSYVEKAMNHYKQLIK
jgi:hypothetical protein